MSGLAEDPIDLLSDGDEAAEEQVLSHEQQRAAALESYRAVIFRNRIALVKS